MLTGQFANKPTHSQSRHRLVNLLARQLLHLIIRGLVNVPIVNFKKFRAIAVFSKSSVRHFGKLTSLQILWTASCVVHY